MTSSFSVTVQKNAKQTKIVLTFFVQKNKGRWFWEQKRYWVSEFNLLWETITIDKFSYGDSVEFMNLFMYKGDNFMGTEKLDTSVFLKRENKYMYIPE